MVRWIALALCNVAEGAFCGLVTFVVERGTEFGHVTPSIAPSASWIREELRFMVISCDGVGDGDER